MAKGVVASVFAVAFFIFLTIWGQRGDCASPVLVPSRGTSLAPLVGDGEEVRALMGYYRCHEVRRGDFVLYESRLLPRPIMKIVRGLPGDGIEMVQTADGLWRIMVNGEILHTSTGEAYRFGERQSSMLRLYVEHSGGRITPGDYLILGNRPEGTHDSTRLGYVHRDTLIAKVRLLR